MTALIFGGVLLAAGLVALTGVGRWIGARAEQQAMEQTAAASFEADFIPEAADVNDAETDDLLASVREANVMAEAERFVMAEEMVVALDEAIAHVEGGWAS